MRACVVGRGNMCEYIPGGPRKMSGMSFSIALCLIPLKQSLSLNLEKDRQDWGFGGVYLARVSPCSHDWSGAHYVDQASLVLNSREPSAFASWVLGLKVCTTIPSSQYMVAKIQTQALILEQVLLSTEPLSSPKQQRNTSWCDLQRHHVALFPAILTPLDCAS